MSSSHRTWRVLTITGCSGFGKSERYDSGSRIDRRPARCPHWILRPKRVTVETSRRGTQVVRERSAKPLCVGSIPTRASSNSFHFPANTAIKLVFFVSVRFDSYPSAAAFRPIAAWRFFLCSAVGGRTFARKRVAGEQCRLRELRILSLAVRGSGLIMISPLMSSAFQPKEKRRRAKSKETA